LNESTLFKGEIGYTYYLETKSSLKTVNKSGSANKELGKRL